MFNLIAAILIGGILWLAIPIGTIYYTNRLVEILPFEKPKIWRLTAIFIPCYVITSGVALWFVTQPTKDGSLTVPIPIGLICIVALIGLLGSSLLLRLYQLRVMIEEWRAKH